MIKIKRTKNLEKRIKQSFKQNNLEKIPVVEKVWGKEIWIVNKEYCGKILLVKKGSYGSLHYHKEKDETFLLIKGKVLMEIDGKKWVMKPWNFQYVPRNSVHRFTGLEDSIIIEFSTHHKDEDTYRLEYSGKK